MRVAAALRAQIVSVDSATVYRGMDVGTDKPSPKDRASVPHHLIDLVDPGDCLTAADFQRYGRTAVKEILGSGAVPLLVGGSGLYFRALVDDLAFPGTDAVIRRQLEAEARDTGAEAIHRKLMKVDPAAASSIHPSNTRRTIRALEVHRLTGRPFSSFRVSWDTRRSIYPLRVAGLYLPLAELDERIDGRVDRLIHSGWVQEVERLRRRAPGWSVTSLQVLGYAQILGYLEGSLSLDQAVTEIKKRTRKFARRQLRWFRSDPRVTWFHDPQAALEHLTGSGELHGEYCGGRSGRSPRECMGGS